MILNWIGTTPTKTLGRHARILKFVLVTETQIKNAYALKTHHVLLLSFFFDRSIDTDLGSQWNVPTDIF